MQWKLMWWKWKIDLTQLSGDIFILPENEKNKLPYVKFVALIYWRNNKTTTNVMVCIPKNGNVRNFYCENIIYYHAQPRQVNEKQNFMNKSRIHFVWPSQAKPSQAGHVHIYTLKSRVHCISFSRTKRNEIEPKKTEQKQPNNAPPYKQCAVGLCNVYMMCWTSNWTLLRLI